MTPAGTFRQLRKIFRCASILLPEEQGTFRNEDPRIKKFCPFCGELNNSSTSKFTENAFPEGRVSRGESLLVPNLFLYDIYSAVNIMTDDHIVPLNTMSYALAGYLWITCYNKDSGIGECCINSVYLYIHGQISNFKNYIQVNNVKNIG